MQAFTVQEHHKFWASDRAGANRAVVAALSCGKDAVNSEQPRKWFNKFPFTACRKWFMSCAWLLMLTKKSDHGFVLRAYRLSSVPLRTPFVLGTCKVPVVALLKAQAPLDS